MFHAEPQQTTRVRCEAHVGGQNMRTWQAGSLIKTKEDFQSIYQCGYFPYFALCFALLLSSTDWKVVQRTGYGKNEYKSHVGDTERKCPWIRES